MTIHMKGIKIHASIKLFNIIHHANTQKYREKKMGVTVTL